MGFQLTKFIKTERFFTKKIIRQVWEKAEIDINFNPNEVRKDVCGAHICFEHYGNTNTKTGWQIDCIKPIEFGGTDDLFNLQPLNWKNRASKKDNYPSWVCILSSA